MSLPNYLRKSVLIPLWIFKDHSPRLTYLKEIEKSQYQDSNKIRDIQFNRLTKIVNHAYANTDFYKLKYDKSGITPNIKDDIQKFKMLPVVTKREIQKDGDLMIAKNYRRESLIPFKTGGSTGKAVTIFWDFVGMEKGIACAIRSFRWAGWDMGEGLGRIWGNPSVNNSLKYKIRNWLIDPQFYLDTMNLNEEKVIEFVNQWKKGKPTLLHGHAHSIYVFAKICKELNIHEHVRPRGIISTSMSLLLPERKVIEEIFGCKVTDLYGSEEVGLIGCECEEHYGLHINSENVYVELLAKDGKDVSPGEEGSVIVTSLINEAMPLIRYKIEDMAIHSNRVCKCGRTLPLMERVSGRIADFMMRKDGSLVAGVSMIERTLTAQIGIQQMQVIQDDLNTFILKIVKDKSYGQNSEVFLRKEFGKVFGENVIIIFNYLDKIEQNVNGKYRFSISRVKSLYDEI